MRRPFFLYNEKIIEALKTLVKNDTKLAGILRSVGIL